MDHQHTDEVLHLLPQHILIDEVIARTTPGIPRQNGSVVGQISGVRLDFIIASPPRRFGIAAVAIVV